MDPKYRPTAKELLLDPFIAKSKGTALLSELVANSLEEIERFRLKQANENSSSDNNNNQANDDGEEIDIGADGMQTYVNV